ncbi:MAG TPA: YhjD/YihY/BrkB family envelope integrity protein [Roseateles sp.]|nr:YhjD/YihY/BrkB family envelope integrity protein [Roseateles sp.]
MDYVDRLAVHGSPLELISRAALAYWFLLLIFHFVLRRDPDSPGVAGILLGVIVADASQHGISREHQAITKGFCLTTAVFALSYRTMPRVKIGWGDVWVCATVTALLFTVGRFLIGLYIGKTGVASRFGAAGSIAVIFVWAYYSAQAFFVGTKFNWVYAQRLGSRRGMSHEDRRAAG